MSHQANPISDPVNAHRTVVLVATMFALGVWLLYRFVKGLFRFSERKAVV